MTPSTTATFIRLIARGARRVRAAISVSLIAIALAGVPGVAAAQPPTAAAQDGFVPVDESKPQEHLPATPLVMIAYGFAWVAVLAYVWSLWSRLGKVEREIAEVSRRVGSGARR